MVSACSRQKSRLLTALSKGLWPFSTRKLDDSVQRRMIDRAGTQIGRAQLGRVLEHVLDHVERIAGAIQVVVDAAEHHRAAQPRLAYRDLLTGHPHRALDTAIEPARWVVRADSTAEGRAQKAARLVRLLPEVDADERFRMKRPSRLFQRLAHHGVDE